MPHHPSVQVQHDIGAIVGAAVGNAFGAPFEFQRKGRYSARFPQVVRGGKSAGNGSRMRTWDRVHTNNPVFTRVLREEWR
jgi:ADP-ribosylglycohydrolase